jgi:hypothetical protein
METKEFIAVVLFGLIGYLLRKRDKDIDKLRADLDLNNKETDRNTLGVKAMQDINNLKMETITINLLKMTTVMEKLEVTIHHLDKNQGNITQALEKYIHLEDRILKLEQHSQ